MIRRQRTNMNGFLKVENVANEHFSRLYGVDEQEENNI